MMARDLSIEVSGLKFDNPFVIGSGPPGTNARVICKAFKAGWGGVVAKTTSLTDTQVVNVMPRYGKLRSKDGEVYGFQNIELISDLPFEQWEEEFKIVKNEYPDKILIGSIMESYEKARWEEVAERSVAAGCDALELNFSCPHGHPETGMGAAMGQDSAQVEEVTRWVVEAVDVPVWAKMTPNITDIVKPAKAAQKGGAHGVSAINTVLAIIGIDLKTLRPLPTVEGHSTPGGYSAPAVKPIGLRAVKEIATDIPQFDISGIGGVVTAEDAIEFLLVGANTVQVCTGAMLYGMKMVNPLMDGLTKFMDEHGFESVQDIVGKSLPYFTTHHHLVDLQAEKRANKEEARTSRDKMWGSGNLEDETASLTSNE